MRDGEQELPTREQIEARAYEIYLQRGGEDGRHDDDWLQAEQDLLDEYAASSAPKTATAAASSGGSASPGNSTAPSRDTPQKISKLVSK
jgi:hypothetical protein